MVSVREIAGRSVTIDVIYSGGSLLLENIHAVILTIGRYLKNSAQRLRQICLKLLKNIERVDFLDATTPGRFA